MEKYAVIQLAGKQFLVKDGDSFEVERQPKQPKFDVLMYFDGKKYEIGDPTLKNISIKVSVLENKKAKKIRVARFKSKSRYRRVKGHRQPISVVEITLGASSKASEKKEVKKKSAKGKKVVKKAKKETK